MVARYKGPEVPSTPTASPAGMGWRLWRRILGAVSTRRLIIAALLCGLAIVVASAVQILLANA